MISNREIWCPRCSLGIKVLISPVHNQDKNAASLNYDNYWSFSKIPWIALKNVEETWLLWNNIPNSPHLVLTIYVILCSLCLTRNAPTPPLWCALTIQLRSTITAYFLQGHPNNSSRLLMWSCCGEHDFDWLVVQLCLFDSKIHLNQIATIETRVIFRTFGNRISTLLACSLSFGEEKNAFLRFHLCHNGSTVWLWW